MENALRAIVARINGVWDDPSLLSYGEIGTDPLTDIVNIAQNALDDHAGDYDRVNDAHGVEKGRTYPNGAPMFASDGMMLDDQGNRSIFDDVDK